ncbi:unannotated protein [freshwater metagenome]|uniref:Unannotated protein n=1 Tax=freshwater metagenome TaxID=449393 RepID=A0A6J6RY32_9ZZZZ
MFSDEGWGAAVAFAVVALLVLWSAFWVIRLAVRYGINDALRANRTWLQSEANSRPSRD